MRALAREIGPALAFAAIGVPVSLAVLFVQGANANPDPDLSYVWRGTNPSGQYCYPWGRLAGWHTCWHDDEAGEYRAIDYSYPDCAEDPVWLEYTGGLQLFKIEEYEDHCTGVRAKIYLGSYAEQNYKGDLHYLHIDPNEFWLGKEVPSYQLIYIGDVLAQEDPNCSWDGPHLHQSADVSAGTPFYSNKLADPTEDDNWVHAIFWGDDSGDEDGDEFTNAEELYIDTDPFDDCSDNCSTDDPWPPDIIIDCWANSSDIIAFAQNINMPAELGVEPTYDARYDLNNDGWINTTDILIIPARVIMPQQCTN